MLKSSKERETNFVRTGEYTSPNIYYIAYKPCCQALPAQINLLKLTIKINF
jgi:hypothetical protein